jgi:hypothetical protein
MYCILVTYCSPGGGDMRILVSLYRLHIEGHYDAHVFTHLEWQAG